MADRSIALIFPGQGCQFVGMGADLRTLPEARAVFEEADDLLGFYLSRLCFEGPETLLNDTANTQPAVYVTSIALWRALDARFPLLSAQVAFLAGHSLGEYTALTAAGALPFQQGVPLVAARAEAMRDAGASTPGGMIALLGLEKAEVVNLVAEVGGGAAGVWVANDNAPGQVVIAGTQEALKKAGELAQARGAKRVVPLAVSVPCHTPLMQAAAERLREALERTTFQRPWAPVVSNVTASPLEDPAEIKAALIQQLSSPVRWVESVERMATGGVTRMIEIGPKAIVSGLVKRIRPDVTTQAVTNAAEIDQFAL